MTADPVDIQWQHAGVPVSGRFEDPYYSLEDGLAETRHVFLSGNGLPERFRPGFHVAELGFGTGLNLFATLQAWRQVGVAGVLRYTGFEAYPLPAEDMALALRAFPDIADLAQPFLDAWDRGDTRLTAPDLEAEIVLGDARETLSRLWEPPLLTDVALHTAPGGTLATYTAAGVVRRGLEAAGFTVAKVPGFGRKRHMTLGHLG